MVNEMGARAEGYKQLDEVIRQWKGEPGGLLPVMQQAQNIIGCVDEEVQNYIAEAMDVPVADIYGIATFYSLFSLEPKGKYAVGLCLGTACYVKGAQLVLDELQKVLGGVPARRQGRRNHSRRQIFHSGYPLHRLLRFGAGHDDQRRGIRAAGTGGHPGHY